MDNKIKIIALDLDGTLLNSDKELTPGNRAALEKAADAGIYIVPTTGRFFSGMPQVVRELPFLRYAVTVNGARVANVITGEVLYRAELTAEKAAAVMAWFDTLPIIYDCYQDSWGWMTRSHQDRCEEYMPNPHYQKMIRELRTPVENLRQHILEKGAGVQKVQAFLMDMDLRARMIAQIPGMFPGTVASGSAENNVEVNSWDANKGDALRALTKHLGADMSQVMAIGDGDNDVSMLEAAGFGVCMANAVPEARAVAGYETLDCDHDGVAAAIERFCF